jgi:hypothetical protein
VQSLPANERLGFYDGEPIKWDGLLWRPVPGTDGAKWFCWAHNVGGVFKTVPESEIPDAFWVEMMKRSLL